MLWSVWCVAARDECRVLTVLDWISSGLSDGSTDRYWTLDPIDGTKGFLRGDQYAIALALIEHGEVVLGVLGCPNLPNPDGSTGAVFAAASAVACRGLVRIVHRTPHRSGSPLRPALAEARFCESVESGHSNQDDSARIAALLGITAEPYRIDSQCNTPRSPEATLDLPAAADAGRLPREDLGPRGRQVRRRAGRRPRHRRHGRATRLLAWREAAERTAESSPPTAASTTG